MKHTGAHHGGAWKVAYADFVTAMMALFMVLWLTSQDESLKRDLAQYFQDPYNTPMDNSMGVLDKKSDGGDASKNQGQSRGKSEISDFKVLYEMAQEFMRLLNIDTIDADDNPVDIEVTSDGLRVTLYNREAHPFFEEGSAAFTPWGEFVVEAMAWLVQRHDFEARIDGHVAASPEGEEEPAAGAGERPGSWELSSARANATLRALERFGVPSRQFHAVTAHGAAAPLPFLDPTAGANDRVSISLVLAATYNKLPSPPIALPPVPWKTSSQAAKRWAAPPAAPPSPASPPRVRFPPAWASSSPPKPTPPPARRPDAKGRAAPRSSTSPKTDASFASSSPAPAARSPRSTAPTTRTSAPARSRDRCRGSPMGSIDAVAPGSPTDRRRNPAVSAAAASAEKPPFGLL